MRAERTGVFVSQAMIGRVWDDCTRYPRATLHQRHRRLRIAWRSLQGAMDVLQQHGHIVVVSGHVRVNIPFCLTEATRG